MLYILLFDEYLFKHFIRNFKVNKIGYNNVFNFVKNIIN